MGVDSSGSGIDHNSRGGGGGYLVELWVGGDDPVSWGNIESREEMGEGSGDMWY